MGATKDKLAKKFNEHNLLVLAMFGIAGLVGVAIVLYLLGFIFPSVANLKFGRVFYIILAGVAVLASIRHILDRSFNRADVLYLLIVFGIIIGIVYYGPIYLPTLFSLLPIN